MCRVAPSCIKERKEERVKKERKYQTHSEPDQIKALPLNCDGRANLVKRKKRRFTFPISMTSSSEQFHHFAGGRVHSKDNYNFWQGSRPKGHGGVLWNPCLSQRKSKILLIRCSYFLSL